MAKVDSLRILYNSHRLSDLNSADHKMIIESITPLFETRAFPARLQSTLSLVIPRLDVPLISLYSNLVSSIWKAASAADEPTAMQILFMLRLQEHEKVSSYLLHNPCVSRLCRQLPS